MPPAFLLRCSALIAVLGLAQGTAVADSATVDWRPVGDFSIARTETTVAQMRADYLQAKPADTAVVYIGFRCARAAP